LYNKIRHGLGVIALVNLNHVKELTRKEASIKYASLSETDFTARKVKQKSTQLFLIFCQNLKFKSCGFYLVIKEKKIEVL